MIESGGKLKNPKTKKLNISTFITMILGNYRQKNFFELKTRYFVNKYQQVYICSLVRHQKVLNILLVLSRLWCITEMWKHMKYVRIKCSVILLFTFWITAYVHKTKRKHFHYHVIKQNLWIFLSCHFMFILQLSSESKLLSLPSFICFTLVRSVSQLLPDQTLNQNSLHLFTCSNE